MLLYYISFKIEMFLKKSGRIAIIVAKNSLTIKSKELFVRVLLNTYKSSMLNKVYLNKISNLNYVQQNIIGKLGVIKKSKNSCFSSIIELLKKKYKINKTINVFTLKKN